MFWQDKWDRDNGKHRFLLCCILNNVHVLSNIMLPVCAHIHFAQYIVLCMGGKKISQMWKKQTGNLLLTADCLETNYFYGGELKGWVEWQISVKHREKIRLIKLLTWKKKHLCAKMQLNWVNGAFTGHVTPPLAAACYLYDVLVHSSRRAKGWYPCV